MAESGSLPGQSHPALELLDPEGTLLCEVADHRMKRADVALTYAMALVHSQRGSIDWPKVNHAIIDRWSLSALKWIKERAWKHVHERRAAHG